MRFVGRGQGLNFANGTREQVLIGFRFALGFCARSRLSSRFGLCLGDLLLNVFEILKRLKFHKPMVPQAMCSSATNLQNTLLGHGKRLPRTHNDVI